MAIRGFLIWAVATVALRVAGQYVFRPGANGIPLLLITLPLMIVVALALLQRYRVTEQRALAAIVLVAPGMLLDTISAMWFSSVFPNIRPDAAGLFGGWLLFCNVVVLLTAVTIRPSSSRSAA
ncbi:MAG: DUF5367 family protein [Thermoanaerobaculia bacterium]